MNKTSSRGFRAPALLAALTLGLISLASVGPALADTESESPDDFGHLSQNNSNLDGLCTGANGVSYACGPVAAVNSFVFLQNMYPHIFGQDLIVKTPYPPNDLAVTADDLSQPGYMDCATCNGGTSVQIFLSGEEKWTSTAHNCESAPDCAPPNPDFGIL